MYDASPQYEQEQQPAPQSYPVSPQMMGNIQASEGSLHYQIEIDEILEDIEHVLKGEKLILDKKSGTTRWEVPTGIHPLINGQGINSVLVILRSRLTKIFILSNLDQDTIQRITINTGEAVIDDLYYNWENYGIKDDASATIVLQLVTDTVYATLRKGYEGRYLRFLMQTHSIQEMQHYTSQDKQGGGSSGFNPLAFLFKKRR